MATSSDRIGPLAWLTPARRDLLALLLGQAALLAGPAAATDFPTRPVTLIVPWAPGGTTDFLARTLQPHVASALGQPLVIDNRPGAAGNVAQTVAARARPDGYTMFFGDLGTTAINPNLYKNMRTDYERDFVALSVIARMPSVLVANPGFPASTLAEFVELARRQPGEVNYVSQGVGTINHLVMEAFAAKAGIRVVHVPNKGGTGPSITDLLGGHVLVGFGSLSAVLGHVRSKALKALAITSPERDPALPDVPTLVESGYAGMAFTTWQALSVPAATPAPEVARLRQAVMFAMAQPEVLAKIRAAGAEPAPSASIEDAMAFSRTEIARWAEITRAVGLTAE